MKGKTVARATLEGEFESLLKDTRPAKWFTPLSKAMLERCSELHMDKAKSSKTDLEQRIADNDEVIALVVDRMMDTTSPALLSAFEKKVENLEQETLTLR